MLQINKTEAKRYVEENIIITFLIIRETDKQTDRHREGTTVKWYWCTCTLRLWNISRHLICKFLDLLVLMISYRPRLVYCIGSVPADDLVTTCRWSCHYLQMILSLVLELFLSLLLWWPSDRLRRVIAFLLPILLSLFYYFIILFVCLLLLLLLLLLFCACVRVCGCVCVPCFFY